MTTTKNHRAEIKIVTRHGHVRPHVRWRFLDLEGASAVVVIAIILAARLFDVIIGWLLPHLTILAARFARGSAHRIARAYVTLRAFYIP